MKRFFLFILLLLPFAAMSQTPTSLLTSAEVAADSPLSFSVPMSLADYVAGCSSNPFVQAAIASASDGKSDTAAAVLITITQGQIVEVFEVITQMPEGVSAEPNKALLQILMPKLAGRPWLAGRVLAVRARNDARTQLIVEQGRVIRKKILSAYKRN